MLQLQRFGTQIHSDRIATAINEVVEILKRTRNFDVSEYDDSTDGGAHSLITDYYLFAAISLMWK